MIEQRAATLGKFDFTPLSEVNPSKWFRIRQATRKFRPLSNGESTRKLDNGSKGTASWAMDTDAHLKGVKREKRTATKRREVLRNKYLERVQQEEGLIFSSSQELVEAIKPEERIVDLGEDAMVSPFMIQMGQVVAWQSITDSPVLPSLHLIIR